jgi:hypothetical protein
MRSFGARNTWFYCGKIKFNNAGIMEIRISLIILKDALGLQVG